MKYLFLYLLFFALLNAHGQVNREEAIIQAIKTKNIGLLKANIDTSKIDFLFSDSCGNALFHAINCKSPEIVKFLLENKANPNFRFHFDVPLILAVKANNVSIVRSLIKSGASVNAKDSAGNSVLMIAAAGPNLSVVKLLSKNGASLNYRNKNGYNARDFAIRSTNKAIAEYLKRVFIRNLPNYTDGPYIRFINKRKIETTYIKHDSLARRSTIAKKVYKLSAHSNRFTGLAADTSSYPVSLHFNAPAAEFKNVKKLLVIGDIHGQFDTLKTFLINNKVIDDNMHWNFGDGTIVFMGDIFDRGEKVTEALWLIYKLEYEAPKYGGRVHLILGNHELMVLQKQLNYLSEKYFYLFDNLKMDYSRMFNKRSVLGQWIRSKNTMIKIDSLLFVHGGIHPGMLNFKLSIDSINLLMNNYIKNPEKPKYFHDKAVQFLVGSNGPLWYRGMVDQTDDKKISEEDLKNILQFYNASSILVGHTYNPEIKFLNNGKIIATDVPFYLYDGYPMQALLFEDHNLLILNSKGERKQIVFGK
jgi:hypothetical protein